MKGEMISFVSDRPWIIFVVMTILFYISVGRLVYQQSKRKKAFQMIKSMKNNSELSKVYLRIDHGYGDFYDVAFSDDGKT